MGMVNTVVPFDKLEEETVQWCSEILELSPMALRMLKGSFNADTDGLAGLQQFAGDATSVSYTHLDVYKRQEDTLSDRLLPIEHKTFKEALRLFCDDKLTIKGRVVYIED